MKNNKPHSVLQFLLDIAELRQQKIAVNALRPELPEGVPINKAVEHLDSEITSRIKRLENLS